MTRRCEGHPLGGSGTAGVLVQYAEEPKEGGTRLRVAQRTLDDCGTAVDNLCIIQANLCLDNPR